MLIEKYQWNFPLKLSDKKVSHFIGNINVTFKMDVIIYMKSNIFFKIFPENKKKKIASNSYMQMKGLFLCPISPSQSLSKFIQNNSFTLINSHLHNFILFVRLRFLDSCFIIWTRFLLVTCCWSNHHSWSENYTFQFCYMKITCERSEYIVWVLKL